MPRFRTWFYGVGLVALFSAPVAAEDFWIKDADTGCEIWTDETPKPDDVATWSGDCASNKASGKGALIWTSKDKLVGRYDGHMENGKLNGKGLLGIKSKTGKGFDRLSATFKNGEPEGKGVFVSANGDMFEGNFINGEKNGKGLFSSHKGDVFEGSFVNGKPQGTGYFRGADGAEYFGDYEAGKRQGTGMMLEAKGGIYLGEFKDDKIHGSGTYAAANGETFQGRFVNGEADGLFVVTDSENKQSTQTWKDGKLVK